MEGNDRERHPHYFTSDEQRMASLRGIGGSCIRNPYQTRGPRYERGPYRY